MPTLIARDTSGVFATHEGETENLRTRTGKRWLIGRDEQGRRRYRVGCGVGPVHYRSDPFDEAGDWQEIDLTIRPAAKGSGWQYEVRDNGYQVRIWQRYMLPHWYAAEFRRAGEWVRLAPVEVRYINAAGETQRIATPTPRLTPEIDNDAYTVTWRNAFGPGLHYRYNISPDTFAKTLVIDSPDCLPSPTIGTAGLRVEIVLCLAWSGMPGSGFGGGRGVSTLRRDADADDEEHAPRYAAHAHLREDLREALWLQEPRAWDAEGEPLPMDWRLERRGRRVLGAFSVAVGDLEGAAWPVSIDTAISEEQVGASADDGYSYGGTWPGYDATSLTGTSITLAASVSYFYIGGARFTNVPVPAGVTIDSALLSVCCSASKSTDIDLTIFGDAHSNAETFSDTTNTTTGNMGVRARTTASARWDVGTAYWYSGTWYQTSDVSTVAAEIIAIDGWEINNAMAFLLANTATSLPTGYPTRSVRSYDYTGNVSGPKFNCTYTEAAAGGCASINCGAGVLGNPLLNRRLIA